MIYKLEDVVMNKDDIDEIYTRVEGILDKAYKIQDFSKTVEDAISHCVDECRDIDHILCVIEILNKEINTILNEIDILSGKVLIIKYENFQS